MSAFDNVQLKMFEKAGILANSYSAEQPPSQSKEKFIERKLEEADYQNSSGNGKTAKEGENTLRESIEQHGVQNPILVYQTSDDDGNARYEIQHGHHRLYVQNDINPETYINIVHAPISTSSWHANIPKEISMHQYRASGESSGEGGWKDPTLNNA